MTYREKRRILRSFIGKTVTIRVDRPYGSVRGKSRRAVYPINCGRVEAPGFNGGELGAYLLGVEAPVREFTGLVIGVVIHKNDNKDKIVVAPQKCVMNQAEIAEKIYFKEKYYSFEIDALHQKSCGGVVYRNRNGRKEYLLLMQKRSGTWSMPKGHVEMGEDERTTALREIFEETGIAVELFEDFREETMYRISNLKSKNVVLFLAKTDKEPRIRENEISDYTWFEANEAKKILNFDYSEIIDKVEKYEIK